MAKGYIAFVLDAQSRQELLEKYPARFVRTIAHHVTLQFGCDSTELQAVLDTYGRGAQVRRIYVINQMVDDVIGAQCVTVTLAELYGGPRDRQIGSGNKLHVTISVAAGVSPVASNCITEQSVDAAVDGMALFGEIQFVPFTS